MMTHDNENFPSDVFTIMEAVRAKVVVGKFTPWILFTNYAVIVMFFLPSMPMLCFRRRVYLAMHNYMVTWYP